MAALRTFEAWMRVWQVQWHVDAALQEVVTPHCVYLDALYYADAQRGWPDAFRSLVAAWSARHRDATIQADPVVQAVREMFRAFGLDPTRYRPSSEALIRRVLREGQLPFILPPVALNNVVSLYARLPIGCYDPDQLGPHITIRLGRPGEAFASLRHQVFHAENRMVVADNGPFGSPVVDSLRTALKPGSRRCLYLFFVPATVDREHVMAHIRWLLGLAREHRIGRPRRVWVFDREARKFASLDPETLSPLLEPPSEVRS